MTVRCFAENALFSKWFVSQPFDSFLYIGIEYDVRVDIDLRIQISNKSVIYQLLFHCSSLYQLQQLLYSDWIGILLHKYNIFLHTF